MRTEILISLMRSNHINNQYATFSAEISLHPSCRTALIRSLIQAFVREYYFSSVQPVEDRLFESNRKKVPFQLLKILRGRSDVYRYIVILSSQDTAFIYKAWAAFSMLIYAFNVPGSIEKRALQSEVYSVVLDWMNW